MRSACRWLLGVLTQLSFLALCAFVNRLGLAASSGYGVASKIVNFAMLIPSALMQSMASFVAQNVGAGDSKRAKKAMFTGIGIGWVFGCAVFSLIMLKVICWPGCSRPMQRLWQTTAYLKGLPQKPLPRRFCSAWWATSTVTTRRYG